MDGVVALKPSQAGARRLRSHSQYGGGDGDHDDDHDDDEPRRTQLDSPVQHRLGRIGGRTGQGYSPYARRTAQRPPHSVVNTRAYTNDSTENNDDDDEDDDMSDDDVAPRRRSQSRPGLLGAVGRALGSIFRSSSSRQLPTSASLKDIRRQFDQEPSSKPKRQHIDQQQRKAPPPPPQSLGRSATMLDLASSSRHALPSSSSTSALAASHLNSTTRSSHSTLNLADRTFNTPAYATRHSRSRQGSPAPSTAASFSQNRSPSPTRNVLAGSVSAFNLSAPLSPAGSSTFARQQQAPLPAFGLTNRSPFARSPVIPRSASTTGSVSGGHSLFPYASTSQRGVSPLPASQSTSILSTKRSFQALQTSPRPRARVGSPLNPHARATSPSVAPSLDGLAAGVEHTRKKQLVWDPEKGLISRDALEREQAKNAPPPPRNEAERILEPKHIHVPEPSGSTLSRSASTPFVMSASPYAGRPSRPTEVRPRGQGLESQLQARDERRRALVEQQRAERERERIEDSQRAERKRRSHETEEREDMSADEELPLRRTTRSMAREQKTPKKASKPAKTRSTRSKQTDAPDERKVALSPPRRSTRAAKSKSPAPLPTRERSPSPLPARERSPSPSPPEPAAAKPAQAPQRSSMRPGKSHSSRQHQSSSRVFSAREEDLPPVDDADLGKIKLPAISFPANFSFGAAPAKPVVPVPVPVPVPVVVKDSTQRLRPTDDDGRIVELDDKAAKTTTEAQTDNNASANAKSAKEVEVNKNASIDGLFGHGPKSPSATGKPAAFSFAPPPPKVSSPLGQPAPASSDFFSKPSAAPVMSESTATSGGKAPNFFSSILADKADSPKPAAPASAPTFSFGLPATTAPSKADSAHSKTPMAAVSSAPNPFAAFGKPVAEIIKDSGAAGDKPATPLFGQPASDSFSLAPKKEEAKDQGPPPSFSFGKTTDVKQKDDTRADAPPSFSFGTPSKTDEPAASAGLFSFKSTASNDTPKPTTAEPKDKADAPKPIFSFGADSGNAQPALSFGASSQKAESSAKPVFSFGAKSDKAEPAVKSAFSFDASSEKAETAAKPAFSFGASSQKAEPAVKPAFSFGASSEKAETAAKPAFSFGAPSAPASSVAESVDEDSGMDDTEPAPPAPAAANKPSGAFSFSVNPPSAASSSSFASAPKFSFGASSDKKEPSPAPAPFGAAPLTQAPTFGAFSPSPSPAPPSPAVSTGFTFGQPAGAAAAPKPFQFGATSTSGGASPFGASPNPFAASAASAASAAPAAPTASAALSSFGAPASTAFGSSSAPMAQTMSAPGFGNGTTSPFGTGAQTPGGTTAPTTGFNFGAPANAAGTTPGGPPFAFGAQSSSTQFGGFGAGAGAAPSSNPFGGAATPSTPGSTTPAGGAAFNIGSGGDETSPNKSGRKIAGLRRPRRA
ncbi:hypothetical protein OIV83_003927 [Microbotryomycetes sp. JL201]|nr:hypothetical protein OIV83_003927 [Microbotryomycetes sp. JL201]